MTHTRDCPDTILKICPGAPHGTCTTVEDETDVTTLVVHSDTNRMLSHYTRGYQGKSAGDGGAGRTARSELDPRQGSQLKGY
ncbi:MAG: hypothetical protein ACLP5H_07170 [Desulfomonilaceae bacterium]